MEGLGQIFQFEWIIIELLVLGILIREWVKTRRLIREDRARRAEASGTPPGQP